MSEDTPRITVSRDALRADLAEMELRLRVYFDEQLRHKAEVSQVNENSALLRAINRGEFSPAHRRAIEELAEDTLNERQDKGWTARERMFGTIGIAVAVLSFAISLYFSFNASDTVVGEDSAIVMEVGNDRDGRQRQ